MIILIAGASHTGKTWISQKLLEKYKYPYLSIDHLKMGLIRSKITELTPTDDTLLTPYLWNITREIIKTAIENRQNLIVEGCYIPFNWHDGLESEYLEQIIYCCLVMTESYINNNFQAIKEHESVIEKRNYTDLSKNQLITENNIIIKNCRKYGLKYILIDKNYDQSLLVKTISELIQRHNNITSI